MGMSPRRLALTLAIGFAVGCIPVLGLPTLVCVALAMTLKLNLPAIQAANCAAMPLQLMLMAPFVRMGGWMFAADPRDGRNIAAMLRMTPTHLVSQGASFAGEALGAWLVVAVPAIVLLTAGLTLVLRRMPVLAAAEAGD